MISANWHAVSQVIAVPQKITLYHNPRCSKSRAALQLLQQTDNSLEIIDYQKTPPSAETLKKILQQLNLSANELMRRGEAQYKKLQLDTADHSEEELIELIAQYPILMERPIAVTETAAAIGRPIDNIVELLEND